MLKDKLTQFTRSVNRFFRFSVVSVVPLLRFSAKSVVPLPAEESSLCSGRLERKKPAPDAVGVHPVPVSAGRYRITSARYWIYCAVVCRINRRYASRSRSMRVRTCSGNRSNCLRIYWRLVISSYLRVDAIERNTHPPRTVPGGWVGGGGGY